MVRIAVTEAELKAAISARAPKWKKWADLKPIFLDFQHHKCGFCESEIGGRPEVQSGRRDLYPQTVEHYRPKNAVTHYALPSAWKTWPSAICDGRAEGYDWLELDESNYVVSCSTCNCGRKKTYFPVARLLPVYDHKPSPEELKEEGPYLIFPFGYLEDEAPESYLTFVGEQVIPHPKWPRGSHEYWRARITIWLLGLNRPDLCVPRCKLIGKLALVAKLVRSASKVEEYNNWLAEQRASKNAYSACAACYLDLYERHPERALKLARYALRKLGREQESKLL